VIGEGRAALDTHMQADSAKWGRVIRERGIKLPK